jgi:hypothetical protein
VHGQQLIDRRAPRRNDENVVAIEKTERLDERDGQLQPVRVERVFR